MKRKHCNETPDGDEKKKNEKNNNNNVSIEENSKLHILVFGLFFATN